MPTPPSSYSSIFGEGGSNGYNPFANFTPAMGVSFGSQPNRGNRRNPFAQFGPTAMGAAPPGFSLDQRMADQGYRKQGSDYIRYDAGGTRHTMSARSAQLLHGQGGGSRGEQGAALAMEDYQQMSGIIEDQNAQRADFVNSLQDQRAQLEEDRQASVGQIGESAQLHADELKELADGNMDKFEQHMGKVLASSKAYTKKAEDMVSSIISDYNTEALDTLSAARGGMATQAETSIQQTMGQMRAAGYGDDVVSATEYRMRGEASRGMSGMLTQFIDDKNKFITQAALQGAGAVQGAYQTAQQVESGLLGQHQAAMARQEQAYQVANQWVQAGQRDAQALNIQYSQMQLEVGKEIAGALQNLTQKYPSLYDSFLQASFSMNQMGNQAPIDIGALT